MNVEAVMTYIVFRHSSGGNEENHQMRVSNKCRLVKEGFNGIPSHTKHQRLPRLTPIFR
jgi:hypothetical protein